MPPLRALLALALVACHHSPSGAPDVAVRRLVAGTAHACALHASGEAWCWGDNRWGQLGIGTVAPAEGAVRVVIPGGLDDLDAAGDTTCAVDNLERTWCWGRTPGAKGVKFSASPVQVEGLGPLARVWMSEEGGCGLTADGGEAWCWGEHDACRAGCRLPAGVTTFGPGSCGLHGGELWCSLGPDLVHERPFGDETPLVSLSGGPALACVADTAGRVACRTDRVWEVQELGEPAADVDVEGGAACVATRGGGARCLEEGAWSEGVGVRGATRVATGAAFACVADGARVVCWGANDLGQLGRAGKTRTAPVDPGLRDVTDVVAGADHTCALLRDGTAWCWGANDQQQVDATGADVPTPTRISGVTGAVQLAADGASTCARTADGAAWCWGGGRAPARTATGVRSVGAGCAVVESGRVTCWNGLPDAGVTDAREVRVAGDFACTLREGGRVTCWDARRAREVGGITGAVGLDLYAGVARRRDMSDLRVATAWDADGGAWAWYGSAKEARKGDAWPAPVAELGYASLRVCGRAVAGGVRCEDALTLEVDLDLAGLDDAVQIAVGDEHLCARTAGGEIRCFFDDDRGQLGDAAAPLMSSGSPLAVERGR